MRFTVIYILCNIFFCEYAESICRRNIDGNDYWFGTGGCKSVPNQAVCSNNNDDNYACQCPKNLKILDNSQGISLCTGVYSDDSSPDFNSVGNVASNGDDTVKSNTLDKVKIGINKTNKNKKEWHPRYPTKCTQLSCCMCG